MSERVEISKAVVSIKAVMVDGKAMTLAVFNQIPAWSVTEVGGPDCFCLGVVNMRSKCPECGKPHSEWALVVVTSDDDEAFLVRVARDCRKSKPKSCVSHTYVDKECERCHEIAEDYREGLRHFASDQVYIAVGGTR